MKITPNEEGMGVYTNMTIEDGHVIISGKYEFLNLAGVYVPKGGVWTEKGATAKIAIFSGARLSYGANLGKLKTERFHGQGMNTKDLVFRSGEGLIDLSASYIEELTLQGLEDNDRGTNYEIEPYHISLGLRDARIDVLDFGQTQSSELVELDLRGATILNSLGRMPKVQTLYIDLETNMPAKMRIAYAVLG